MQNLQPPCDQNSRPVVAEWLVPDRCLHTDIGLSHLFVVVAALVTKVLGECVVCCSKVLGECVVYCR